MKYSNTLANKCEKETDYFVLFLMSLFFIAGYLLFKKKPKIISPSIKRKLPFYKDSFNKNIENDEEEMNFFLDE